MLIEPPTSHSNPSTRQCIREVVFYKRTAVRLTVLLRPPNAPGVAGYVAYRQKRVSFHSSSSNEPRRDKQVQCLPRNAALRVAMQDCRTAAGNKYREMTRCRQNAATAPHRYHKVNSSFFSDK